MFMCTCVRPSPQTVCSIDITSQTLYTASKVTVNPGKTPSYDLISKAFHCLPSLPQRTWWWFLFSKYFICSSNIYSVTLLVLLNGPENEPGDPGWLVSLFIKFPGKHGPGFIFYVSEMPWGVSFESPCLDTCLSHQDALPLPTCIQKE